MLPLLDELLGVGLDGLVEALGHRIPPVGGKDLSGLDRDEQAKRKAQADESVHAACVNVRKTCVLRHCGSSPLMELRTSRWFPGNLSGCSPLHPRRGGSSWCCRRSVESPRPTRMRRPMTSWWLACFPATRPRSRYRCDDTTSGCFGRLGRSCATTQRPRMSSRTPGCVPTRTCASSWV